MILHSSLRPALDCELIAFHGELDAAAAPDLRELIDEVAALGHERLLIDLGGCAFIDSLGIAALVAGSRPILDRGGRIAVCSSSPQVRRTLELTGVDELLAIWWTRDEAIGELSGEA